MPGSKETNVNKTENYIIKSKELKPFLIGKDFGAYAKALLEHQQINWPLAKQNYALLANVQVKEVPLTTETSFYVQCNPERITSTGAKVDEQSIAQRRCFLCATDLPIEQKGLMLLDKYLLLVNPYPIFPQHFTVPLIHHQKQLLTNLVADFVRISKELEGMTVFYNGPKCGASAPDHLHFQAIGSVALPLFAIETNAWGDDIQIGSFPFAFLKTKGTNMHAIVDTIEQWITLLPKNDGEEEPRLNLLCNYQKGVWEVILIPRTAHRPDCYFLQGEEQIMVSPASLDLAGYLITPRIKDYACMEMQQMMQIFQDVVLSEMEVKRLLDKTKQRS